jgi:hypothetical protein
MWVVDAVVTVTSAAAALAKRGNPQETQMTTKTRKKQASDLIGYISLTTGKFVSAAEIQQRKLVARQQRKPRSPSKAQIAEVIAELQQHPAVASVEWRTDWDEAQFDVRLRMPWISHATGDAWDNAYTMAEARALPQNWVQDPTADAEWDD